MKTQYTTMAAAVFALAIVVTGSEAQACTRGQVVSPAVAQRQPCKASKPMASKPQCIKRTAPVSDHLKHATPAAGPSRCGGSLPVPDQQDIAPPLQFSLPKNWQKTVGGIA